MPRGRSRRPGAGEGSAKSEPAPVSSAGAPGRPPSRPGNRRPCGRARVARQKLARFSSERRRLLLFASRLELGRALAERENQVVAYQRKARIKCQRAPQERNRIRVTPLVDVEEPEPRRRLRVSRRRELQVSLERRLGLVVASLHGESSAEIVVGVRLLRSL